MKLSAAIISISVTGLLFSSVSQGSSTSGATSGYTLKEKTSMTICVGMTDMAYAIARRKTAGDTLESVKRRFTDPAHARLAHATADKVYADNFTGPFQYAQSFFIECGSNLAKIPPHRMKAASYCMNNVIVALAAHGSKTAGIPIEKFRQQLPKDAATLTNQIVDTIYAQPMSRGQAAVQSWNLCMTPYTLKEE